MSRIAPSKQDTRSNKQRLLSRVGVIDEVLERILLETAVQLVRDDILLAAFAALIRRKQFKQVGRTTGQDHSVSRNFRLADLSKRIHAKTG